MRTRPYPPASRGDDADDYHGELISDPYRWLEDTGAPQTVSWVKAQNELTAAFLAAVPAREEIRARLTELWDFPRYGVPFERGGRWFQTRHEGLRNQPVVYVMDSPGEPGRPLLDPNLLSDDGTLAVTGLAASDDGSLLGYGLSRAGSDWRTWHVRDVATGADTGDVVRWQKFYPIAWRRDGSGFYYSGLERPTEGAELLEQARTPRIAFHRLGTSQAQDEVVFATPGEPEWLPAPSVSHDDRYLIVHIRRGVDSENQVHVLDLRHPRAGWRALAGDFGSQANVIASDGSTFYLLTDHLAGRRRVVACELATPGREHWREVIPETDDTLVDAHFYGGRLVCHYLRHACSLLRVHEVGGAHVRDIALPPLSSLAGAAGQEGIAGRPGSELMHFGVASFTESGSLWSHHLGTGETTLVRRSSAPADPARFAAGQVFVRSGDGTQIPMFIVRDAAATPTGDVPCLLYGYGGFDISLTPSFSATRVAWLERGGLLAVANLRGGGEYGRQWHDAGKRASKQNVFDDFAACASWLAASGWSRPGRIAIHGGSNGGLLVGATLTQRPELIGAAVAEVGVFDMLRFHRFTIGWAWVGDFGDPGDPGHYRWLRGYSPLHNVREGTAYPATLLLTGDHDDRVVPGHSFKFAATLQAAQRGGAPVLIRVETEAGHGEGKPAAKQIAEQTDILAFLHAALGIGGPPPAARHP
jgi:prolyl oligopeptidase